MNGTSSGTVSSGSPASSAAVTSGSGASWYGRPCPSPSARQAAPPSATSRTYARQAAGSIGSNRPIVMRSSPPCSHFPGVGRSETVAASIVRASSSGGTS